MSLTSDISELSKLADITIIQSSDRFQGGYLSLSGQWITWDHRHGKQVVTTRTFLLLWIISPWGGEAFAIPDQRYSLVTFTKRTFSQFRPLAILHSDQGRNFESALLQEVCNFMGITKTRTTSHHPVILNVTERQNRTIQNNNNNECFKLHSMFHFNSTCIREQT